MKKIAAVLLAAVLSLSLAAACAQQVSITQATADFDVTMTLPAGYTMTEDRQNGNLYVNVVCADETAAGYYLSIGYSEEYDGRSMGELTDEELEAISAAITPAFQAPECLVNETEGGTRVLTFAETEGESFWAQAVTVYKGYFITVQIEKPHYAALSDEDIDRAVALLSGMSFVE